MYKSLPRTNLNNISNLQFYAYLFALYDLIKLFFQDLFAIIDSYRKLQRRELQLQAQVHQVEM